MAGRSRAVKVTVGEGAGVRLHSHLRTAGHGRAQQRRAITTRGSRFKEERRERYETKRCFSAKGCDGDAICQMCETPRAEHSKQGSRVSTADRAKATLIHLGQARPASPTLTSSAPQVRGHRTLICQLSAHVGTDTTWFLITFCYISYSPKRPTRFQWIHYIKTVSKSRKSILPWFLSLLAQRRRRPSRPQQRKPL